MKVFLLHGLARTQHAMQSLKKVLVQAGFSCVNIGYPSRRHDIATLATEHVLPAIQQNLLPHEQAVFVTHSMGGIILRYLLANERISTPKAAVMLAPPNHGSEIVDKLAHLPPFGWLNGSAGKQLGTAKDSMPSQLNALGVLDFPVGVIAGNKSRDPLRLLLPSANDGKVTVASTKLAGMADFLVLPISHTFMMRHRQVQQQIIHFIRHECFYT